MRMFFLIACLTPLSIEDGPGDRDGDGSPFNEDCDDNNPGRFPGNVEVCDGRDQDCDEQIDEGSFLTGFEDLDGDGFGAGEGLEVCSPLDEGLSFDGNDCDDGDASVAPGAEEVCDLKDNDCDARVDEGAEQVWVYGDVDGDGYGNSGDARQVCGEPEAGWVYDDQDCDDSDSSVYPGATELCDGLDQDCSGEGPDSLSECSCEAVKADGNEYIYCGDYKSWFQAQEVCQAMSTDLQAIGSNKQNRAIKAIADEFDVFLWVGMSDVAEEEKWEWVDGSGVSYTNWAPGEPNNYANDEDCLEIGYYASGAWNDNACSVQHPFICTYNGLAPE